MLAAQGPVRVDFLYLLDALVRADTSPPGFRGRVCFGVHTSRGTLWWMASFGANTITRFFDEFPDDADVAVGITEEGGHALLGFGEPARIEHQVTGNKALLDRFLARYVGQSQMAMGPGPGSLI